MALIPGARYPLQTVSGDAAYPHGRARDVVTPNDGTGTPLQQDWVNDLFGFEQALLTEGGVAPDGNPDRVGASQYVQAIRNVAGQVVAFAVNVLSTFPTFINDAFVWGGAHRFNGPVSASGEVTLTAPIPRWKRCWFPLGVNSFGSFSPYRGPGTDRDEYVCAAPNELEIFPIELPHLATITAFRARCTNHAVQLVRLAAGGGTGANNTRTVLGTLDPANPETSVSTPTNNEVNRGLYSYHIEIVSAGGTTLGAEARFKWGEVQLNCNRLSQLSG